VKTVIKRQTVRRSAFTRGFSLPEIVLAVAAFAILAFPLYRSMQTVQTDTRKSINYFRAMELANEAIEYVRLLPVDKNFERNAEGFSGSILVERADSSLEAARLMTGEHPHYRDDLASNLQYSSQYNSAYFYRTVEVHTLSGADYSGLVRKVVVTVYWDNSVSVTNLHDLTRKTSKVTLATLVTDWNSQP